MPRKRSISGRSRRTSITSDIYLQTEKINKRLRSLERAGNFGKYKGKELLTFVKDSRFLKMSRRRRLKVSKLREATFGQLAIISKKFKSIIKSKGFSNIGIKKIREETRAKVKKYFEDVNERELTNKELDTFFELLSYRKNEILDRIPPSDFFNLVLTAQNQNADENDFVELLSNYVTINNEDLRKEAKKLYHKYVAR